MDKVTKPGERNGLYHRAKKLKGTEKMRLGGVLQQPGRRPTVSARRLLSSDRQGRDWELREFE